MLALATNFVGYAAFARLLGDDKPQLLAELDIKEVRCAAGGRVVCGVAGWQGTGGGRGGHRS